MNEIEIVWTKHAGECQKEWEIKLGIKRHEVENASARHLFLPNEISVTLQMNGVR